MANAGSGLLTNATSRFTVNVEPAATADPFSVQALQLVPGLDGTRVMKFQFFDSANHQFNVSISLADIQFEAFNIFGGQKTAQDQHQLGGIF